VTAVGLLDTSVLIALGSGRPLDTSKAPVESFVSVVTLAELQAGVLAAGDVIAKARRLATLTSIGHLRLLPIDAAVAEKWAELRVRLSEANRRMNVNDLWIAAIAAAHGLPIVTRDSDFDAIEAIGGPEVIRV
jgi:predicted nucleic acid-binding protein